MARPVLFALDDDSPQLAAVAQELYRRYGADYEVVCESSVDAGLAALEAVEARGGQVAVMLVDTWLPGVTGVEFLARAHRLHPHAQRILLLDWGDRRLGEVLPQAGLLGQVDDWITKPWRPGDEHFHQAVSAFLFSWARTHQPTVEAVRIVGEQWSARSHGLRDILSRSGVRFGFYTAESADGQALLDQAGAGAEELPVVITYDGRVLIQPSNTELVAAMGVPTSGDPGTTYDVLIIGAGPAGIAAAVYAASEGLHTVGIEAEAIGGQASSSSLIRNYPGFPRGISGAELTSRAFEQAGLLGARFVYGGAAGLRTSGDERVVALRDGGEVTGRAVIVATGVSYRRLGIPAVDRLVGKGVFYGAAAAEAQAMSGRHVYVVGGANSAGQAAVHLSRYADEVTLVVRRSTLTETMSAYLVREIEASPRIQVRYGCEVVDGQGEDRLTGLTLWDRTSGAAATVSAEALFVLIGAEPHTSWLPDSVLRDTDGFVMTGADLLVHAGRPPSWPLERSPMMFETSVPGVFAIGDVRHGSVKRVASAVGEGSVAVRLLHDYLDTV